MDSSAPQFDPTTEKARHAMRNNGVSICSNCTNPGHLHHDCPFKQAGNSSGLPPPGTKCTFSDFMRGKDLRTMPMEEFDKCWEEFKTRVKHKDRTERNLQPDPHWEEDDPDHEVNQFVHETLRVPSKNAQVLREVMRSQGYNAMLQIARVLLSVNQGRNFSQFAARKRELEEEEERLRWMEAELERTDAYAEVPSEMMLIRNLPPNTTEQEIEKEIERYNLKAQDIRFMKNKKCTSRGFAFVEFATISEAVRWKELTKGSIEIGGMKALLKYCFPLVDKLLSETAAKSKWTCHRCNVVNLKWRTVCFICNSPPTDSSYDRKFDASLEVSRIPTNTLLLRNLDALTTEEKVGEVLRATAPQVTPKGVKIPRDPLLNVSKKYCLVELHSVKEAAQMMVQITASQLEIDGMKAVVSYARRTVQAFNSAMMAANAALAAAQWTNQTISHNAAAPSQTQPANLGTVTVNGVSYPQYPSPDVSTFQYDQTSGFYYDSQTGLYYDASSQYFYHPENQKYMYWDGEHRTYLPAAADTTATSAVAISTASNTTTAQSVEDKRPKERQDKAKMAKKIAKDMEKWARTLNQKKESFKSSLECSSQATKSCSSTADAAFAVLEKKGATLSEIVLRKPEVLTSKPSALFSLPYGGSSDSEDEDDKAIAAWKTEEAKLADANKMACLLCKRQFTSREALTKHQQLSNLHKQNLTNLKKSRLTIAQLEILEAGYRDRAKERRNKFGAPESYKEQPSAHPQSQSIDPPQPGIGSDNIGSRMLKAMGWSEGQGLGKDNRGTASFVQIEAGGLGTKTPSSTPFNYRAEVRKALRARFYELS